jgi:uncharacterized protein
VEITELLWPEDRIAHIARHGVSPEEVEDVCFGRPLVLRAKSGGPNPAYYVLGETAAGRFLFCVVIRFPGGRGYPHCEGDDAQGEATIPRLEATMKPHIPQTDSIEELADFWDSHDVIDVEDELEEVHGRIFQRPSEAVAVPLTTTEREALRRIAAARGLEEATLIHEWVKEKLPRS